MPLLALTLLFNGYQAYQLKFKNSGSKTEFISQVHTSEKYQELATILYKKLDANSSLKILALRDNTWPVSSTPQTLPTIHTV